jgi:EAL domain-containing protein (putative c-di-GMP-specific phosphodiesterase class I)
MAASVGLSLFPDHATTAEDLMRRSAVALQSAKRIGGSYMAYQSDPHPVVPTSLVLLGEFREAIQGDQLRLFYQPQVDLRSRRMVGVEALLRWQHPSRGLLTPDRFLSMAARTNLMRPLLEWVVRTALAETHRRDLHVAVNLAMRNLLEPGLKDIVMSALEATGRSPAELTLEITEDAVMSNPEMASRTLDEVAQLGCRLSIDDFGTGYSSMAYLQRLSTHELKIDRSFVTGIPHDSRNTSIVEASVALAHGLGLRVVAEGVESEGNVAALITFNCDRAQGYLFGRPTSIDELLRAWP